MRTVLITGTSRGLGLGLTRACLERGDRVFAVTRRAPGNDLMLLCHQYSETLQPIVCDLDQEGAADQIKQALQGAELYLALFNAGIYGPSHQDPQRASREEIAQLFLSNAIAPVRLAQALRAHMQPGGTFAFMSSQMASVELARAAQMSLYGASKAALNSLLRSWSQISPELCLLALHPGWVRTAMGGDGAPLSIEESVAGLLRVLDAQSGQPGCRFIDHLGETLPW
jgi:NAD(P)-dependent dehydrogenase (short-subunit alcohol dehydrogenase family)